MQFTSRAPTHAEIVSERKTGIMTCTYVTAAMLVELEQKNTINFFCLWHQDGRQIFVF